MKREDTKTKVNDPMKALTDKKMGITPGEWKVTQGRVSPGDNSRRPRFIISAITWLEFITVHKDPMFKGALIDDPQARDNAILIADAGTTYNKTFLLPSELAEQLEEALTHLGQMFEGFDFESGLGRPEAADAENAWNFLLSHTNVRTSPTDPTPPEK